MRAKADTFSCLTTSSVHPVCNRARQTAQGWLSAAERHVEDWGILERRADELRIPVAHLDEYPPWRDAARTLAGTGEAVLGDEDRYGVWLDTMAAGRPRAGLALDQLRERIVETRTEAVGRVEVLIVAAEKHMDSRDALRDAALDGGIEVTQFSGYSDWRRQADRLVKEAKAVLSDPAALGAWLPGNPAGQERMERRLAGLGEAIRDDEKQLARARRETREQRQLARQLTRLKFTMDTGDAAPTHAGAGDDTRARKALWRLRRVYDWDGRAAERDRQAKSLERWETLKENWNRQVERGEQEGVHLIYTRGYKTLRKELRSIAHDDPYLGERARDEIRTVIHRLGNAEDGRAQVEKHRDRLVGRLEYRRDAVEFGNSWDKRPIPDRERYEAWRDGTDEVVAAAERFLENRTEHGIHLDGLERRGKSLRSALARVREILRDDDRHIAATLAGKQEGEDRQTRADRIARLLDDPDKLREMRKQREAEKRQRKAQERRRKGRYQSRGISM